MSDLIEFAEAMALERVVREEARAIASHGPGASLGAKGLLETYLPNATEKLMVRLLSPIDHRGDPARAEEIADLLRLARQLDIHVLTLAVVFAAITSVATQCNLRTTYLRVGKAIADEAWAAKLLLTDRALAGRIEKAARLKHASVKHRRTSAKHAAGLAGFRMRAWSPRQELLAGSVFVDWLVADLPDLFEFVADQSEIGYTLTIAAGAAELAAMASASALTQRPLYVPTIEAPVPWTGVSAGGYPGARRIDIVRTYHRETKAELRAAMQSGQMQPFVDALNALQGVPYRINRSILEVMQQYRDCDIAAPGIPSKTDIPYPPRLEKDVWEAMSEGQRRAHRLKLGQIKQSNIALIGDRLQWSMDLSTAEMLAPHERFYTPMNADWRGRVYPLPRFNFQRHDPVRSLFEFADGVEMTEEGLYWLRVHTANCGDFEKISKRPFEERVQWTFDNAAMIASIVANPLADERWHEADKPWQFLAACMELVAAAVALDAAQSYRTHLPIAFDGSCSGLQHLCMMTKAPEGSLVNLTANDLPADIYQTVADVVQSRIENDIEAGGDDAHLAKLWLDHGVTRKLVKRNVMTFAYSSKQFGMSQQHMEDTMRPLALEVLKGVYAQHPLGPDGGRAAAKYLARHTYDAICQIVRLPAEAMTFLQTIARGLAHEGKCLSWVTPTGLPCANRYYEMQIQRVRLWMHDTAIRISVADGHSRTVDKASAANAIAPNVVHSLDAAHLCLTANAAKAEGIVTATVHDSFACHAPNASRFRDIIREQLVAMYDNHDVLAEIRQSALSAITSANSHRIPKEIEHGTLDRQQTLRSPFAFA